MDGIINVLKPSNMTSHDVVGFLRRVTGIKKIGHTGTLDPNAAGVLPVCIGKATRVAEYFNDTEISKSYRAELKLGKATVTEDRYSSAVEVKDFETPAEEDIKSLFQKFTGEIEQIPPMYSAKKVGGKKLYELAREGIEVERKKRKVSIYRLSLLNINEDGFLFDVDCSSGTYVRTLCKDMAEELGTVGHMSFLLRTRVGKFRLGDSLTLEEIEYLNETGELENYLKSLDYPFDYMEKLKIGDRFFDGILNGVKIPLEELCYNDNENCLEDSEKNIRVYCRGKFIGIGRAESGKLRMKKVLISK